MADRNAPDRLLWKLLLIAAGLWFLYTNASLLIITLISLMIAAAVMPLADELQRRRVPRMVTVTIVYLLGIGGLILLISLLVPVVIDQGRQLAARAPAYRELFNSMIDRLREMSGRFGPAERFELPTIGLDQVGPVLRELGQRSLYVTRGLFSGTASAVLILFAAAYIVVDRDRLRDGLLAFLPPSRRARGGRIGALVVQRMGGYVIGQMTVSLCIAVLLSIGLALIGIEAPVLIAVTAGALNFVPFLGSTIGLLLALLLALNTTLLQVGGVLLLFGGVQFLEGNFLTPHLLERKVALHPLAVMGALIVGANLAGLIGIIVSVPILAGVNVLVQELWVRPLNKR